MKKWRLQNHSDRVSFEEGHFIEALAPDSHGPRIFLALNIFWDGEEITMLSDAATDWGLAPWALEPALESKKLRSIGGWKEMIEAYGQHAALALQAVKTEPVERRAKMTMLLTARAAARLAKISNGQKPSADLARHCLRQEIDKDMGIQLEKKKAFMLAHPDWTPPKP